MPNSSLITRRDVQELCDKLRSHAAETAVPNARALGSALYILEKLRLATDRTPVHERLMEVRDGLKDWLGIGQRRRDLPDAIERLQSALCEVFGGIGDPDDRPMNDTLELSTNAGPRTEERAGGKPA